MTNKYNFWSFCQDATAAVFAVPTCGASLVISPTARGIVGNIIKSDGDGGNNTLDKTLEEWKIKNAQWEAQRKADKEEMERLRKEAKEEKEKQKQNNKEIDRLRAVINDPHSTEEEKSNAKKRIVLLEDENKDLKEKLNKISKKFDELGKTPPPPSKPWNFPKLGFMDKVLVAGGLALVIYLIIPENKKK